MQISSDSFRSKVFENRKATEATTQTKPDATEIEPTIITDEVRQELLAKGETWIVEPSPAVRYLIDELKRKKENES